MHKFNGKTAYIFGGSSGIGLETGKLLAAAGAHVFIFARTVEKLQAAEKAISTCAFGENQHFGCLPVDVTDHDGVAAAIETAIDRFGIPDLLINSAGRGSAYHFKDISYAEFDRTMKINLYGTWNTVAALVGRLPGGLAYVNVLACMLFGSISGSAAAAVSSVGGMMIPEMNRKGYDRDFNVALTTTSAITGLMLPPSNAVIVYAIVAGGVSIPAMFVAL